MKSLTQVWFIIAISCFILMIIAFKTAGRLGLFVAFIFNLFALYLLFHRNIIRFFKHIDLTEIRGQDPTGFKNLILKAAHEFGFSEIRLFTTSHNCPPLIWKDLNWLDQKQNIYIVLNSEALRNLNLTEQQILVYFLLSHAKQRSMIRRKVLFTMYALVSWASPLFSPVFNALGRVLGLHKEVMRADMNTLLNLELQTNIQNHDFALFMRKFHALKNHTDHSFKALYFFSLTTQTKNSIYKLNFQPNIYSRQKQIAKFAV